ncbi:MAG: hypothetical protein O2931_03490, partial [Planctomycetota bacterium]|nr:hypothetical protein [Planctomycetota bacterium]
LAGSSKREQLRHSLRTPTTHTTTGRRSLNSAVAARERLLSRISTSGARRLTESAGHTFQDL